MNYRRRVTKVFTWTTPAGEIDGVTIQRQTMGFMDHHYPNVTDASWTRLLSCLPMKPAAIDGSMLVWNTIYTPAISRGAS